MGQNDARQVRCSGQAEPCDRKLGPDMQDPAQACRSSRNADLKAHLPI